jgi:hypothetical protein
MRLPCVSAVTVELQSARGKVQYFPFRVILSSVGQQGEMMAAAAVLLLLPLFSLLLCWKSNRYGQWTQSRESCFCQNTCPIECIYSKIGRKLA